MAVVVGRASGASGYRHVDEARGNTELKVFRLRNCFIANCSSSWAVCSFTYSFPQSEWNDSRIGLSWVRGDTQWAGGPCMVVASGTKTRHRPMGGEE